jgi:assimilatory nitrate reductase catalytic subunit
MLPPGDRSEVADTARGMRRIAVKDADGSIAALLYLTRSGTLPERGWIEDQFTGSGATLIEMLAGRSAKAAPDRGPVVCLCHDVRENEVLAAQHGGACTVAAIGECTRAGTNCGSCRPLIARLLKHELVEAAE